MKEPQTLEAPALAPPAPQGARYRYISGPPATVSLRLADIASQIPEAARLPSFDAEQNIELPCRDVFAGPVPKLPFSRLAQIAREYVCLHGIPDFVIMLPATQLALAYRFVGERELLEATNDSPDSRISASKDFAPKSEVPESADGSVCSKADAGPPERETLADEVPSQPAIASPSEPSGVIPQPPDRGPSATPEHPESAPPSHLIPVDSLSTLAHPAAAEPREHAARKPGQAVAREAVLEHMPKVEPKPAAEIPDQDSLQSIFMTEEFLSVNRVVELCGGLPGIKSCVLAHGAAVVASHNVPESIDLVSLSAHALEMLAAMRQSAAQMGIGAVPAVTIHSEKGPITFFHQNDLCLLVLHKDRGFVPGVREKLQQIVENLSNANLALPANASRPALTPRLTVV